MVEQVKKCSKLKLFISCSKLRNQLDFGKLDTFIDVYEKVNDEQWCKVGNTEVVLESLDPVFVTNFIINYYFEEKQCYKFKVYNSEDGEPVALEYNFLGFSECSIGQLVGAKGQTLVLPLMKSEKDIAGYMIIRCEQVSSNNDKVLFQISGQEIEDVSGFFSPFEPFFILSRALEDGSKLRVHISDYENGRNVNWKPFEVKVHDLCADDFANKIILDVYDYKTSGDHEYIASAEFSLIQVLDRVGAELKLINQRKRQKNKNYTDSGFILISSCKLKKVYSFIDYLRGGCQISLEVAIDFTGSNKHPSSPNSLHYIDSNPLRLNQYQQALFSVSEILLHYDYDKKVPMYGFGGKMNHKVSHCFNLSLNPEDPYAYGIQGIMDMYKQALNIVGLSGPTLFSEILHKVITNLESQESSQDKQEYTILLILTDGEINDMEETINWIVRGSDCPLSIVIVGIGNESFTKMKVLDADETPLVDSQGKRMRRDIVQFVPFREVNNSPHRLAKEVLDEIPREIVNYFRMKDIIPNPPIEAPVLSFKGNLEEYFQVIQSGRYI